jgi:hypothetical protein
LVARTGAGTVVGAETASLARVDVEAEDRSMREGITSPAVGDARTGDGSPCVAGMAHVVDEVPIAGVDVESMGVTTGAWDACWLGRDSKTWAEYTGARRAEWHGPTLDHASPGIVGGLPESQRSRARFGTNVGAASGRTEVIVLVLVGVLAAATGFRSGWRCQCGSMQRRATLPNEQGVIGNSHNALCQRVPPSTDVSAR